MPLRAHHYQYKEHPILAYRRYMTCYALVHKDSPCKQVKRGQRATGLRALVSICPSSFYRPRTVTLPPAKRLVETQLNFIRGSSMSRHLTNLHVSLFEIEHGYLPYTSTTVFDFCSMTSRLHSSAIGAVRFKWTKFSMAELYSTLWGEPQTAHHPNSLVYTHCSIRFDIMQKSSHPSATNCRQLQCLQDQQANQEMRSFRQGNCSLTTLSRHAPRFAKCSGGFLLIISEP
jgi:hypothetical protein